MVMELLLAAMCLATALSAARAALQDRKAWPVLHGLCFFVMAMHGIDRAVRAVAVDTWGAVHPISLPGIVVMAALIHLARLNIMIETR